jgi:hypothetical protein
MSYSDCPYWKSFNGGAPDGRCNQGCQWEPRCIANEGLEDDDLIDYGDDDGRFDCAD